jgi:transmembrane sensor
MEANNYEELLKNYRLGLCSEAEIRQLEAWYADWHMTDRILLSESKLHFAQEQMREVLMKSINTKRLVPWRKISIAASIALVIGAGLSYLDRSDVDLKKRIVSRGNSIERIPPGKQGAILTLADGKKIRLSDVHNGILANQAGVSISKSADGQLVYQIRENEVQNTGVQKVNTLSTEKGETYQLRLPDGSLAVLNAASSLTYAANLMDGDGNRRIQLNGEAYFEVKKDRLHPFIVQTAGQQVQVLGTRFNVNSYPEEGSQRTTLLEGSVKVMSGGEIIVIAPGEQAISTSKGLSKVDVNVSGATSWKDGFFNFEQSDIQTVMRQLARWYNLEVTYDGPVPTAKITGKVYRNADFSEALTVLRYLDIHYALKGRTITIKP